MNTQTLNDQVANLTLELRRGILPLAVMSLLQENKYGYALINELQGMGIDIDQGTLYPMLRRLESQGLLQSSWLLEGTRPRRYYMLNDAGKEVLALLTAEWQSVTTVLSKILKSNINDRRKE